MNPFKESIAANPLKRDCFLVTVDILNFCRSCTVPEYALLEQLRRAVVSIGSNVMESHGAETRLLSSSKLAIAYRECLEARFQLSILAEIAPQHEDTVAAIDAKLNSIAARLYVGIRTLRDKDTKGRRFHPRSEHEVLTNDNDLDHDGSGSA
jgi:four helix bundle protein